MTFGREALARFITRQLLSLPPDRGYKPHSDGSVFVRCPLHSGGHEKTPSFRINANPAKPQHVWAYCHGCKQVCHGWNETAELFSLAKIAKHAITAAERAAALLEFNVENPVPPDWRALPPWPNLVPWRNLAGPTVERYHGRAVMLGKEPALYFPVIVHGENLGGITARTRKDEGRKTYINTTGTWSNESLFGYDQACEKPGQPLWIVEGPRDTGTVDQHGGRVVGLIGSTISARKLSLIRALDPPSLIIATDPDDAGDQAGDKLEAAFAGHLPLRRLRFKPNTDPADLKPAQVTRVNAMMENGGGR